MTEPKKKRIRNKIFKARYTKTKFSAETIVVIKKALQNYKTDELTKERLQALELFSRTDDFFIIMYGEKEKTTKRSNDCLPTVDNQLTQTALSFLERK
jgi:hypothetical protein